MKINGILFLLFLALQLLPCSTFAGGSGKYEDLKIYFPINKGSVWVYDFGGHSSGFIISVTDCIKDDDGIEICTFAETTDFSRNYFGYSYLGDVVIAKFSKTNGGDWKISSGVKLQSPLKVGGPTWDYAVGGDGTAKRRSKVLKVLPSMEVKAGKFKNVVKVEEREFTLNKNDKWKEYISRDGSKMVVYYYYAPNVGLIGVGAQGVDKLTMELVEYRPGTRE
jgi:hypothetical protein